MKAFKKCLSFHKFFYIILTDMREFVSLSTGVCNLKNIFSIFGVLAFSLILLSCDSQVNLPSIQFDACFTNYKTKNDLIEKLELFNADQILEDESPNYSVMAVVGCLYYQLGQFPKAVELLQKSFQESTEEKTKRIAASALSLIYLKLAETDRTAMEKINPYIASAGTDSIGRWMLVLKGVYTYFFYDNTQALQSSIKWIKYKNENEGGTDTTVRFLEQMEDVYLSEQACRSSQAAGGSVVAMVEPAQVYSGTKVCSRNALQESRIGLFSWSKGYLAYLLKEAPFHGE